ncbi:hypothetical protein CHUAL_013337 [Chamberlinius hualienensis]
MAEIKLWGAYTTIENENARPDKVCYKCLRNDHWKVYRINYGETEGEERKQEIGDCGSDQTLNGKEVALPFKKKIHTSTPAASLSLQPNPTPARTRMAACNNRGHRWRCLVLPRTADSSFGSEVETFGPIDGVGGVSGKGVACVVDLLTAETVETLCLCTEEGPPRIPPRNP